MPGSQVASGAWGLPLWCHVLFLGALLAVAVPFLHLDDTFTADEGAYAIQVRALDRGAWEYDYAGEPYDQEGRWFPLVNGVESGDERYAYVKHPAVPLALLAATRVVGEVAGLHLLSLAGALGLAAAAWLLAAEVDPAASRPAFWLAAASPVAVNAYLIWAHAPSAAVAGFALWAGVRLVATGRARHLALMLACVAAGVLLRAEGLLFGLALAVGLLAVGLRHGAGTRWRRRLRPQGGDDGGDLGSPALAGVGHEGHGARGPRALPWRVGVPAVCVVVAGAAAWAENLWVDAIIGSSGEASTAGGKAAAAITGGPGEGWGQWLGGRLKGAWYSLFRGAHLEEQGMLLVVVGLVLVAFAGWAFHRRRAGWERDVLVGLGAAAAVYVVRGATGTTLAMTGLLAAWPLAVLGLLAAPFRSVRSSDGVRLLAVVAAAFGAAVLATQYRFGGGFEWGGRFFFPVLAPLAIFAALACRRMVGAMAGARRPVMAGLLVVLAAVPVATGLVVLRNTRPLLGDVADEVATGRRQLVVTHSPALPPAAWRSYPEVGWMLVPPGSIVEVTRDLRASGAPGVMVVATGGTTAEVQAAVPGAVDVTGPAAANLGWRTLRFPD